MSEIKVKVTEQVAEFVDTPPIAAGDVNVDSVRFELSSEWKSGYNLMAVFWRADDKTKYTALLDENYVAVVPSEVMRSEGIVVFGVCGISTSKTLTSSTLSYTLLDGAVVKFDTANVDIYDELIKLFKNTKIVSGKITKNGHLVFTKVDGTTVDVGSGISLTDTQVNNAFNEFIELYGEEMDYKKVNLAYITKLREMHKNGLLRFWVGTKAEYEAITPAENVFYIITDDDPISGIQSKVNGLDTQVTAAASLLTKVGEEVATLRTDVDSLKTNGADELIADDNGWTVQKFATGFLIAKYNSVVSVPENVTTMVDFATLPSTAFCQKAADVTIFAVPQEAVNNVVYNATVLAGVSSGTVNLVTSSSENKRSYQIVLLGRWKNIG